MAGGSVKEVTVTWWNEPFSVCVRRDGGMHISELKAIALAYGEGEARRLFNLANATTERCGEKPIVSDFNHIRKTLLPQEPKGGGNGVLFYVSDHVPPGLAYKPKDPGV